MEGTSNFPEKGVDSLIKAIGHLFDPGSKLENINNRLVIKVEEARSLIRDGYIPQVRAIGCSNGIKWNESAEKEIVRANFGSQVEFEYFNHDRLLLILQAAKPVNDSLQFSGKAIVEDFNFSRVLVGRSE